VTIARPGGRSRAKSAAFLLMFPSFALIFGLLLFPLGYSLVISFLDLHATAPWLGVSFVGLGNFARAFTSPDFGAAIGRTLYLAVVGMGLGIPISFIFALVLNRPFKFRGLVRGLMIIPWVVPGSVQGLLWARIYDPHYGALNGLLYQMGIISHYQPWLIDPSRALIFVALANLWATVPMMTLLYLAGLQGIPKEMYEAAHVDGAGPWVSFWRITFPLLLPVTLITLILKTIDAFSLFDLVYILTGGGPADSTQVTGYYLYQSAFTFLDYGYASALAWIIALATAGLAILYSRLTRVSEAKV
jgi:ABC-type sugar transport system permease subunit